MNKIILIGRAGKDPECRQVSGRSDVDFAKRFEMDAYYARKRSIFLDILFMLKTPLVMISGQGAV